VYAQLQTIEIDEKPGKRKRAMPWPAHVEELCQVDGFLPAAAALRLAQRSAGRRGSGAFMKICFSQSVFSPRSPRVVLRRVYSSFQYKKTQSLRCSIGADADGIGIVDRTRRNSSRLKPARATARRLVSLLRHYASSVWQIERAGRNDGELLTGAVGHDVLGVCPCLKLKWPVLVGHSIAGGRIELDWFA